MAGLFGGGKAGAAGKGKFDWGDAAMGFFGVPANAILQRKQKQREAEAEAAQQAQVSAMIDNDPALSTPEAKLYAKANPKAYIEAYMTRFQSRQFGAGGGSVGIPGAGGQMAWQMAPSRHEYQGSVTDIGPAAPGQKATVTPQHEGTQWVTPQTGTQAFPVNSFSGLRRDQAEAAGQAPFQPGEVVNGYRLKGGDDTDPANWEPVAQGGAGSGAPRTFPF
jgi:hypothetical protein